MLIVVAGTSFGMPAPIATWRAGFWPSPAVRTQPSTTSSTSSPAISARSSAARTAHAPSSVAAMSLNCPPKLPTGVRSALTITASSIVASSDEGHLIRAPWPSIRSIFRCAVGGRMPGAAFEAISRLRAARRARRGWAGKRTARTSAGPYLPKRSSGRLADADVVASRAARADAWGAGGDRRRRRWRRRRACGWRYVIARGASRRRWRR